MEREEVVLKNPERFSGEYKIPEQKVNDAIKRALKKLESKIDIYTAGFPRAATKGTEYIVGENNNWVCGMHTGCFLLSYELSGEKKFLDVAKKHIPTYKTRLDKEIGIHDHDVGFAYSPSCVAMYKLFGDGLAKECALRAANFLYDHSYFEKGGFIMRISSKPYDMGCCRTMMDTLMNIALLYWAGEVTGDKKFTDAANAQIKTTDNCLIRADSSSYHHYQFEPGSFKPLYGVTLQGNRDESTWSRGHSWGVLGLPIAYTYSGDENLLTLHKNVTYYFLNHLPEDLIPYWDFDFTDGDEPRDSSAAVISVCGMLEAAKYLPDSAPEKHIYKTAAAKILEAVIDECSHETDDNFAGLIAHVTGAKPQGIGVDACAVYGDYFYLEALMRYVNSDWKRYW